MSITLDLGTFGNILSKPWLGQYGGSQGMHDYQGNFVTGTYNPSVQVVPFNSSAKVSTGFNTYFKLQGFNTSTNKYEVWFSMGSPLLIPPSGHLLSNIEVVLVWIDR
jgi:hypothetical protein